MKVLFAVSNEEISENIVKKYQREYKEIISYKNVYYFNAILKELQKDKTYDRVVISEDLENFTNNQYDQIDKFIFEKLDSISDEASNYQGDNIPIILICSDRRTKSEPMLVKLFGISIYDALIGADRNVDELCKLINKPRSKKEAKLYYKIDSDDVNYKPENENDVSEVEIQNILSHYKRLGKNADKYVESFNNIASQYNDIQLKVICKFLPLNVRAVLEEKSPKYQQIMAFNSKVTDKLRKSKRQDVEGTSEKLLKSVTSTEKILSKPVVIPNAVNMKNVKKLSRPNAQALAEPEEDPIKQIEREINTYVKKENEFVKEKKEEIKEVPKKNDEKENIVEEEIKPAPRRRGRPRKNPLPEETQEPVKKRRGRPKKTIENGSEIMLPGFEEDKETEKNNKAIAKNDQENIVKDDPVMPGFDEKNETEDDVIMPGFDEKDEAEDDVIMPGFEEMKEPENDVIMPGFNEKSEQRKDNFYNNQQEEFPEVDLTPFLVNNKKIACFVGTSKNGTSFVVNNVAQVLSSKGISTAILDLTQNRNDYYIYTNNEDTLRNKAMNCFQDLLNGVPNGIQANKNLTVYTSLPNEDIIRNAGQILKTLISNYSIVLIDCDFQTPISYFSYAQEVYLVQSMDVLTIQPLTAFLNMLRSKNVLDESKLRIVLNKVEKLRRVNDKIIIGGMSSYNDPAMTYMVNLFDKNVIRYISIPFDEQVYVKYLEGLIDCEISLKGYPKNIIQVFTELANMLYSNAIGKTTYRPPTANGTDFSPSINSTLEQMRKY
mgnify:CR=1 FL=1